MVKEISLNFGAIKDTITRLAGWEVMKESTNNTLKEFIQKVKMNPILMKQHLIYKNFTDCKGFSKDLLAERYIAQNLNIIKGTNWNELLEENKKVRIGLLENHHVESDGSKNNELYESIHTLIESVARKDFMDIDRQQKAYEFLLEYLTKNKEEKLISEEKQENPPLQNWKFITKLAVNNFNKRYAHLDENEQSVLKIILSEDDKKVNYIEDLRQENLKIINNLLKEELSKEKQEVLLEFKGKLEEKQELTVENCNDYVLNYFELNKTLGELS